MILIDLEATCWDQNEKMGHRTESEIIEIGAINTNHKTEFQMFIKPIKHPDLSVFCKSLTHIQQSDVDAALPFSEVFMQFMLFVGNQDIHSWGYYDRDQLQRDLSLHNVRYYFKHSSLKHTICQVLGVKPMGLSAMLHYLGLKFEGTQHRAIDDTRNLARIVSVLRERWRNR